MFSRRMHIGFAGSAVLFVIVLFSQKISGFGPVLTSATSPTVFGGASLSAAEGTYSVRDFGARGDGRTLDTQAIARAVKLCFESGGGTVVFPAGQYVTGTFEIFSRVTLHLEAGAIIKGSPDTADYGFKEAYGITDRFGQCGEGRRTGVIVAVDAEHIAIEGYGVIDGRGDDFMDKNKPHLGEDYDPLFTAVGPKQWSNNSYQ